jgi:hypothetical protein
MLRHLMLGFAIAICSSLSPVWAQWGNLTGQFVYDGKAPAAKAVKVTKDVKFCGTFGLKEESLVVNEKNSGLANVIVSLYLARGKKAPKPHPQYAETAEAEVRLDNEHCRFNPHVVLLRTTQTLLIGNKDKVGHNTKIDTISNVPINPIVPAEGEMKQKFPKEERLPALVSCSIHPWMNARVLIKESPYMAVSDEDGKFTIENLPEGKWTFQVWHETCNYVEQVTLGGKKAKWRRGRVDLAIKEGDNDLGQIKIAPSALKKR